MKSKNIKKLKRKVRNLKVAKSILEEESDRFLSELKKQDLKIIQLKEIIEKKSNSEESPNLSGVANSSISNNQLNL